MVYTTACPMLATFPIPSELCTSENQVDVVLSDSCRELSHGSAVDDSVLLSTFDSFTIAWAMGTCIA